jgi:hypothetical protein
VRQPPTIPLQGQYGQPGKRFFRQPRGVRRFRQKGRYLGVIGGMGQAGDKCIFATRLFDPAVT